ncbi:Hypothetical predicted protein, partial [Olea europaea subsp. europaea]
MSSLSKTVTRSTERGCDFGDASSSKGSGGDVATAPSKVVPVAPHTFDNASVFAGASANAILVLRLYSSIGTRRLRRCTFLPAPHLHGYGDIDDVDGGGFGRHDRGRGGDSGFSVQCRCAIVR